MVDGGCGGYEVVVVGLVVVEIVVVVVVNVVEVDVMVVEVLVVVVIVVVVVTILTIVVVVVAVGEQGVVGDGDCLPVVVSLFGLVLLWFFFKMWLMRVISFGCLFGTFSIPK